MCVWTLVAREGLRTKFVHIKIAHYELYISERT